MSDFVRFECPLCVAWKCRECGTRQQNLRPEAAEKTVCYECRHPFGDILKIRHVSKDIALEHLGIYEHERMVRVTDEVDEDLSPIRRYTAEDFANAQWCLHPHGLFGHRFGTDPEWPWMVAGENHDLAWYTDEGLADRADFEPVTMSLKVHQSRLQQIIKKRKYRDSDDCYMDVVTDLGVEIVSDKIEVPAKPGVRFSARPMNDSFEYSFITFSEVGEIFVISCDPEWKAGAVWKSNVFDSEFIVTNTWDEADPA